MNEIKNVYIECRCGNCKKLLCKVMGADYVVEGYCKRCRRATYFIQQALSPPPNPISRIRASSASDGEPSA